MFRENRSSQPRRKRAWREHWKKTLFWTSFAVETNAAAMEGGPWRRSTAPAAVRRGRDTPASCRTGSGRGVPKPTRTRKGVLSRRTASPRQHSPLRWVRTVVMQLPDGWGRIVAAGAVGSGRELGRVVVVQLLAPAKPLGVQWFSWR